MTNEVALKRCPYCSEAYLDGRHEPDSCESNPEVQRKQYKSGSIEYTQKRIVLGPDFHVEGQEEPIHRIRRMYWYHSRLGQTEINVHDVLDSWKIHFFREKAQWLWPRFLKARGFTVIREVA